MYEYSLLFLERVLQYYCNDRYNGVRQAGGLPTDKSNEWRIVMKKLLLAVGVMVSVAAISAGSASADSYSGDESDWNSTSETSDWNMDTNTDVCDRISERMARVNARFDQDSERRLERQQRLIDRSNEEGCMPAGTITDELVANGNFTTLVTAIQTAGLADALSAPGDKTVFAPTDQAFQALPAGTVEALLQDIPTLTNILTEHVVAGAVDSETAANAGMATALNGNALTITDDGCDLMVNGVRVVLHDIMATNGIIHVIDRVLLP
jgi:uncharacterized surface protein with fasciclin (FAS1) repeats